MAKAKLNVKRKKYISVVVVIILFIYIYYNFSFVSFIVPVFFFYCSTLFTAATGHATGPCLWMLVSIKKERCQMTLKSVNDVIGWQYLIFNYIEIQYFWSFVSPVSFV